MRKVKKEGGGYREREEDREGGRKMAREGGDRERGIYRGRKKVQRNEGRYRERQGR